MFSEMNLPKDHHSIIVIGDQLLGVHVDVGYSCTVLIDHHVAVVHSDNLLLDGHYGRQVPEHQKSILASNYYCSFADCGT